MNKCEYYKEFTWGEPPLEPGENGTLHTEYKCKKKKGFQEIHCDGDKRFCELKAEVKNEMAI